MLTKDQFGRVSASVDNYGRVRQNVDQLGRVVQAERPGREAADQLEPLVQVAQASRRNANSNDNAQMAEKASVDLIIAQKHLMLADRFDQESSMHRAQSNRFAALPGGGSRAERERLEATKLAEIAQRHREAAQLRQEEGEKLVSELRSIEIRQRPPGEQQDQRGPRPRRQRETPPAGE